MNITVEYDVPIPPKAGTRECIYPFASMREGSSFAIPVPEGKTVKSLRMLISSRAYAWAKRHAPGAKFTTRVEGDNAGVRIWLLTKPAPLVPTKLAELPVAKVHKLANKEDEGFDKRSRAAQKAARKAPAAFDIPSFTDGGKPRKVEGKRY